MFFICGLLLNIAIAPNLLLTSRDNIANMYWDQLSQSTSVEKFQGYAQMITNYQLEIIILHKEGKLSGAEAFDLYSGSLSYLAAGFRKIGWKDAARQTYEGALTLVTGTDNEVFFLSKLADLHSVTGSGETAIENQMRAIEIYRKILDLPQFLDTDRATQTAELQILIQKANVEAHLGLFDNALDSIQNYVSLSNDHQIPLVEKSALIQGVRELRSKTGKSKKADIVSQAIEKLAKNSEKFPQESNRKRETTEKKSHNFDHYITVK